MGGIGGLRTGCEEKLADELGYAGSCLRWEGMGDAYL